MIPPEKSTSKKIDTVTQATATEPTLITTTIKETNEVVAPQPVADNQQRIGCKQGEFLPSIYCNKVRNFNYF